MSPLLDTLINHTIANSLAQTAAKDIFKDFMPSDQSTGVIISINEYAGTGNAKFTNMSVRSIQVLTRGLVIADVRKKSWDVFKLLCPEDLLLTIGDRRMIVATRSTPTKLSVDTKGRITYFFNIAITTQND